MESQKNGTIYAKEVSQQIMENQEVVFLTILMKFVI